MGKVVVCETLLKPLEIPIPSSTGDGTYHTVISQTLFNDSVCDCKGFQFRGTCRHVAMVADGMCHYHRPPTEGDMLDTKQLGQCPVCRSKLILYELEPEFEARRETSADSS